MAALIFSFTKLMMKERSAVSSILTRITCNLLPLTALQPQETRLQVLFLRFFCFFFHISFIDYQGVVSTFHMLFFIQLNKNSKKEKKI